MAAARRRRLERWRSAGARREVLAVCAAPSFSFVCTQSHRELTHSPCFVSARKQRAGVMNCCDERRLVSVVTRVEHHRARDDSWSGDGVGRGCPIPSVVVKVLSGFVHLKRKEKKEQGQGPWALGDPGLALGLYAGSLVLRGMLARSGSDTERPNEPKPERARPHKPKPKGPLGHAPCPWPCRCSPP